MPNRILKLLIISCLLSTITFANDSLWVKFANERPMVTHSAKRGENIFKIARCYGVPPATLADRNNQSYQNGIVEGTKMTIPIDKYNYSKVAKQNYRPIYYKVRAQDDLRQIAQLMGITISEIQVMNNLNLPNISTHQTLTVGWLFYQPQMLTQSMGGEGDYGKIELAEQTPNDLALNSSLGSSEQTSDEPEEVYTPRTEFEEIFMQQTEGRSLQTLSGAAVFYPLKTHVAQGVYYGLCNEIEKGNIVKVSNPSNEQSIYVKIVGKIPNIKLYANAVICLSNNAIKSLQAVDKKMFCQVSYLQ